MTVSQPNQNPGDTLQAQQAAALEKLRTLFSDISGLSADQLIASAPFLEIGLDSLLLTQASTAIEKSFGVRVTFRQLLEELSSLDALAAHLAPGMPAPVAPAAATLAPVPSRPQVCLRLLRRRPPRLPSFAFLPQGGVEALVRKQLEIMEKQLEMLRNPSNSSGASASMMMAAPPAAQAVSSPMATAGTNLVVANNAVTNHVAAATNGVSSSVVSAGLKKPEMQAFGPYKPVQKGVAGALPEQQQKALDALIARYTNSHEEIQKSYRGASRSPC